MALAPEIPVADIGARLIYEARVDIGPVRKLGASPLGERRIIDITGGVFEGSELKGRVLPGGADRQTVGADGVLRLDALYELETDDGVVITVRNRALLDNGANGGRYARSFLQLTAPLGPYEWLNRRIFIGTVDSLAPAPQVLIRVFVVE